MQSRQRTVDYRKRSANRTTHNGHNSLKKILAAKPFTRARWTANLWANTRPYRVFGRVSFDSRQHSTADFPVPGEPRHGGN